MSEKRKMKGSTFTLILIPLMVLLLGAMIAVTVIMNYWSVVMNQVFDGPSIKIEKAEGTEDWDTDYYGKAGGSEAKASEAAERIAVKTEEEGLVLLKNRNSALPLTGVTTANRITVNAMGWSFFNPTSGGAGAGAIGTVEMSPKSALSEVGVDINTALETKYKEWRSERPASNIMNIDWSVPEMPAAELDAAMTATNASANPVSVVWLSRSGGECHDLPVSMDASLGRVSLQPNPNKHYLQTTVEEEYTIQKAVANKGADGKVIVILNSPAAMEMGAIEDNDGVDAVMWVGNPGNKGYLGIANVIVGKANPSGRLPDTFAANFKQDPAMKNFSDPNIYTKGSSANNWETLPEIMAAYNDHIVYKNSRGDARRNVYYVGYEEGIYMGYRWYETAAAEGYYTSANLPAGTDDKYYNRDNGVVYPFGHGLSYTKFEQQITASSYSRGVFNFTVSVKNTGTLSGKDVVQLYAETPYVTGGIEKSKVVLAAFGKTKDLAAGATGELTLSVKAEDIASYDDAVEKCYVLDEGKYTFHIATVGGVNYGSHSWKYTKTSDKSRAEFDKPFNKTVFGENNPRESEKTAHSDKAGSYYKAATNVFDQNLVGNNLKVTGGGKTMSRNSFAGTFPTAPTAEDKNMSAELKALLNGNLFDTKENVLKHVRSGDAAPEIGKENGIDLVSLRGTDFDDPAWDLFTEQYLLGEMTEFAEKSGWGTAGVTRLGKPLTRENDGPQALKRNALGGGIPEKVLTAFPCPVVMAATWNTELLYELGKAIGEEGLQYGVNGWYAPGLNTHRTPFSGRNYEYFSEDPVLAGRICAAEVSGAASKGLYAFVKHFALNDQEGYARSYNAGIAFAQTDCVLLTWATEQTMREIYLKSFEIVFKEATTTLKYLDGNGNVQYKENFKAATATMTSFNYFGNNWAGGDYNLITELLRNEWGFNGLVLTDSVRTDFMTSDQMLYAGGDACLFSDNIKLLDTESATARKQLYEAAKHVSYTVAHSNAMQGIAPGAKISYSLAPWQVGLVIAWVVIGVAVIGGCVWIVLRLRDERRNPDKYKAAA